MAAFYIHIPFCKKVCYYCDFHFSANLKNKDQMIDAIVSEIENRKTEWEHFTFETLYLGGGTPSILTINEINRLTKAVFDNYRFANDIEFTIEVNPDDLTPEYLNDLKNYTSINRFSVGTQSFHDDDLIFLNRRHNGQQAIDSLTFAKNAGFTNITLDLIYGFPGLSTEKWQQNIEKFIELDIPHLSAYHLMVEPKTVFHVFEKKGRFKPVDEQVSAEQYQLLTTILKDHKFEHYETSNFCKNNLYSKHNTSYWKNIPYIGIGPSAHSYNGKNRRWNIAVNTSYIEKLKSKQDDYFDFEVLTDDNLFNEYILTSLRTSQGVSYEYIRNNFAEKYYLYILEILKKHQQNKQIQVSSFGFKLTEEGWLLGNLLMSEFFYIE